MRLLRFWSRAMSDRPGLLVVVVVWTDRREGVCVCVVTYVVNQLGQIGVEEGCSK